MDSVFPRRRILEEQTEEVLVNENWNLDEKIDKSGGVVFLCVMMVALILFYIYDSAHNKF